MLECWVMWHLLFIRDSRLLLSRVHLLSPSALPTHLEDDSRPSPLHAAHEHDAPTLAPRARGRVIVEGIDVVIAGRELNELIAVIRFRTELRSKIERRYSLGES